MYGAWTWGRGARRRWSPMPSGPAWSPDGARLAFDASWAGPRQLDQRWHGRNPRQLTSDSSEAVIHAGPRWSPDGRRLVFRRIEKTDSNIMTAEVANDATTRVTHDASTDLDPAWSPDGRWIYFASNRGAESTSGASRSARWSSLRACLGSLPPAQATTSSRRPRRMATGSRSRCAASMPTSGNCRSRRRRAPPPARRPRWSSRPARRVGAPGPRWADDRLQLGPPG